MLTLSLVSCESDGDDTHLRKLTLGLLTAKMTRLALKLTAKVTEAGALWASQQPPEIHSHSVRTHSSLTERNTPTF